MCQWVNEYMSYRNSNKKMFFSLFCLTQVRFPNKAQKCVSDDNFDVKCYKLSPMRVGIQTMGFHFHKKEMQDGD